MAHEVFTDEWAQAWLQQINNNENYKQNAVGWEWPLVLTMKAEDGSAITGDRTVYLDLKNGECIKARTATSDDLDSAAYIVSANAATWKKILAGDMDMMSGIMWGKIKLEKGDLGQIAQYVSAAKQLIVSATRVETIFPEDI